MASFCKPMIKTSLNNTKLPVFSSCKKKKKKR